MNKITSQTFILIHGAWHGKWCWDLVSSPLRQKGHQVLTPDLPGHGDCIMDFTKITLETYVESISKLVKSQSQPVILVGHSLAGMIISQVAENIPDKIQKLIYVAGFLPKNNTTASSLSETFSSPGLSRELHVDKEKNSITLHKSTRLKDVLYNACSPDLGGQAIDKLQDEPFQPFIDPVQLSEEKFGKVAKVYIECGRDEAILPYDQQKMQQNAQCHVMVISEADHSPFLSTPESFINILQTCPLLTR